jgi:hypothetical protein
MVPSSCERVWNRMRRMGLLAIHYKPRMTILGSPCDNCPCLVDLNEVIAVDQACVTNSTDFLMSISFLCLVAIIDFLFSHFTSWRHSNSLAVKFSMDKLEITLSSVSSPKKKFFIYIRDVNVSMPTTSQGRRRNNQDQLVWLKSLLRKYSGRRNSAFSHLL